MTPKSKSSFETRYKTGNVTIDGRVSIFGEFQKEGFVTV